MSFFTDFVIARPKEAARIAKTPNPTEKWPGFSWKTLTSLDIAHLYGQLLGPKHDVVELDGELDFLPAKDGSMVQLVPERFIALLAELEPKAARATAKKARELEPFKSWSAKDLDALIDDLVTYAKKTRAAKSSMLILTSGF